jgi:hypothetical protein
LPLLSPLAPEIYATCSILRIEETTE